jgi:hypothetical protein
MLQKKKLDKIHFFKSIFFNKKSFFRKKPFNKCLFICMRMGVPKYEKTHFQLFHHDMPLCTKVEQLK